MGTIKCVLISQSRDYLIRIRKHAEIPKTETCLTDRLMHVPVAISTALKGNIVNSHVFFLLTTANIKMFSTLQNK